MSWIDRMERKGRRFGIPNLMLYIVIGNLIVYIFDLLFIAREALPFSYYLGFSPQLILQGQVWRLISFIFVPPDTQLIFIIFALYFYYFVGSSLEQEWGSFRFTVYYLTGMLATIVGGFFSYFVFHTNTLMDMINTYSIASYLNLSLFFAFATLYPNQQVRLFFFLPIKVKYLGFADALLFVILIIRQPIPQKIAAVMAIINYLIFFGSDWINKIRFKLRYRKGRKEFQEKMDATWRQD